VCGRGNGADDRLPVDGLGRPVDELECRGSIDCQLSSARAVAVERCDYAPRDWYIASIARKSSH
jgi:hypothetical protein